MHVDDDHDVDDDVNIQKLARKRCKEVIETLSSGDLE